MYRRTISLFSNLPTLKVYRKGIQNLAPALGEHVASIQEWPRRLILGKWASGILCFCNFATITQALQALQLLRHLARVIKLDGGRH